GAEEPRRLRRRRQPGERRGAGTGRQARRLEPPVVRGAELDGGIAGRAGQADRSEETAMKAKLGLLDRVREARRRLRDPAAGTLPEAGAERTRGTGRHTAAEAGLDEVHDAAATRLASTRTVRELLVLDHERRMAINLLADAKQEVVVARAESDRRRARLQ